MNEFWSLILALKAQGESAATIEAAVDAWLDAHPEATTTVADGSITWAKLAAALKASLGAVESASRVSSLTDTPLASGEIVESVGIPIYLSADDLSDYSAYGLTESGWYVLARITKQSGTVGLDAAVTGAAGYIATYGEDHVDVAVRFEVAAQSQAVTVTWTAGDAETFVFKASDLAVRNLDYRVTMYLYDATPFVTWLYDFTADATFQAGKAYYTQVRVRGGDDGYELAEVTAGDPVPAYWMDGYVLTTDTTFQDGTIYYTESEGQYTPATVTTGDPVPAGTYYVVGKVRATGAFSGVDTYYTKNGDTYTEASVTPGEDIPAYFNHTKAVISGMIRNITYQLPEKIDCPVEFILPEIDDETHGCWFEIRCLFDGTYSMTLTPPEGVKIATEHTQAEKAGINMINLHYTDIAGVKLWRFMNTVSTVPADAAT